MAQIPVKAFLPPPEDPAGITFKTLNLTVFDKGLSDREALQPNSSQEYILQLNDRG